MIYRPDYYGEPTAQFILIAVKAMLRTEASHKTILAVIADLEAIGEAEREQAEARQVEIAAATRDLFMKANP